MIDKNNRPNKFYITTPIYYVNDKPHIGHTYTTVAADVLARWRRAQGDEVYFLTGTDENSQKNVEAAKKSGKDIREYVDEMAAVWRETWLKLGISFDRFIRTTSPEHERAVHHFFEKVEKQDDIYLSDYEGYYCIGCEDFIRESDLADGLCPEHKIRPEIIKEKNYFFKLTKYREPLLKHLASHPEFVQPESRRNEVVSYIRDFMTDVSISRQSQSWGIKLPLKAKPGESELKEHVFYVWFDALLNYFSGIGYAQDDVKFDKYWPADLQLVGKGIIKFHCAIWPAMLMSAGYPPPKIVFAHGHFTLEGEKISKSLGNSIDPLELMKEYPFDAVRYFMLREIPFGEDGDFSRQRLKERYNADLANDLGNLVQRTLNMINQYLGGKFKPEYLHRSPVLLDKVGEFLADLKFDQALQEIWQAVTQANKLIDEHKPWQLAKDGESERLAEVLASVYAILQEVQSWLVFFLPDTAKKIESLLSAKQIAPPSEPLFPKK